MSVAFCQPFTKADLVALGSDLKTIHGAVEVSVYWTGQEAGVLPGNYNIEFDHPCVVHHVGVMVHGLLLYILPGLATSTLPLKDKDTIHVHIPGRAPGQQYTVGELIEDLKRFPSGYKVTRDDDGVTPCGLTSVSLRAEDKTVFLS